MELNERILAAANVLQLKRGGFSSDQIACLFRVKALYERGAYQEITPEYRRQAFVRWLYLRGRLQS